MLLNRCQAARRRIQEEAAERRRQETENRGIKDPEKVRRQQEKAAELERRELEAAKQGGTPTLKVQFKWPLMVFETFQTKNTMCT